MYEQQVESWELCQPVLCGQGLVLSLQRKDVATWRLCLCAWLRLSLSELPYPFNSSSPRPLFHLEPVLDFSPGAWNKTAESLAKHSRELICWVAISFELVPQLRSFPPFQKPSSSLVPSILTHEWSDITLLYLCLSLLGSEKPHLTGNGNAHRDPQCVETEGHRSAQSYMEWLHLTLPLKAQGSTWKKRQKDC